MAKAPFPGAAFDCDLLSTDQASALHEIIKKTIKMLNSPIMISHVINFEGFSHHLVIYFVVPLEKERFSIRYVNVMRPYT